MAGLTCDPTTKQVINNCHIRRMHKTPRRMLFYINQARMQGMATVSDRKLDPIVDAIHYFESRQQSFVSFGLENTKLSDNTLRYVLGTEKDVRQTYKLCWPIVCNTILEKVDMAITHLDLGAHNFQRAGRILNWLVSYFDSVVPSCEENMEGLTINEWIEKQGGWMDLLNSYANRRSCTCPMAYLIGPAVECNYCANLAVFL